MIIGITAHAVTTNAQKEGDANIRQTSKPLTVTPDKKAMEGQEVGTIDIEKIIRYSSKSSLEFTRRGMYYEENKEFRAALEDYTRALELTPNRSELFIRRAVCYEELGEYPQAIKDLTEVLAMRPYRAEVYSMRGKIYVKMEKKPEALWDFYKAEDRLEPANRDYYAAAELYAYTAKNFKLSKKWQDAINEYDKAILRNPENGDYKRLRKECADELAAELKAAEEAMAAEAAKKKGKKKGKLPKEEFQR